MNKIGIDNKCLIYLFHRLYMFYRGQIVLCVIPMIKPILSKNGK